MKLGTLANNICRICGSETMGADIGCSCQKLYNKATYIVLNRFNDSLQYNYEIEMKVIMDAFVFWLDKKLKDHDNDIFKTFKSNFKREFCPSVYDFYKKKGYVSKKQLDIVKKMIDNANELYEKVEKNKRLF